MSAKDILRKHLSPALVGPNWEALIEAIATGDDYLTQLAQDAFNQMFISSASGKYLARKASDNGFIKPSGIGLPDDKFRELVLQISAEKLTLNSFLKVLEIYYGEDALRASIDSSIAEPYNLSNGNYLLVSVDGNLINIPFVSDDFVSIIQATAAEVAAQITRIFELNGLNAFAKPVKNISLQANIVRIYSGALGLRGQISVNGGSAQNVLLFPTQLATTQAIGTQWTIDTPSSFSALTGNTARFTFIGGTNPTLQLIRVGDYVNIFGGVFNINNRGAFAIQNVTTTYFEISNFNAVAQSVTQANINDLLFFRPTNFTINSKSRASSATEGTAGEVDVILNTTTQIVTRTKNTAAYGVLNTPLNVAPALNISSGGLVRASNIVTVTSSVATNLQSGNTFYLVPGETNFPAGIKTVASILGPDSFTYNESGSNATSSNAQILSPNYRTGTTVNLTTIGNNNLSSGQQILTDNLYALDNVQNGLGWVSLVSVADSNFGAHTLLQNGNALQVGGGTNSVRVINTSTGGGIASTTLSYNLSGGQAVLLSNGNVLIIAGNGSTNVAYANIFSPVTNTIIPAPPPAVNRLDFTATVLQNGKILITGGVNNTGLLSSCELFDPSTYTWSSAANMNNGRTQHTATLLNDGRVLVTGGQDNVSSSLSSCEIYNPLINVWTTTASMSTARCLQTASLISNGTSGNVLVVGGSSDFELTGLTSCEIFNPATSTWTTTASLPAASFPNGTYGHFAVIMSDKRLLVGGGTDGSSELTGSAILDPVTLTWTAGTLLVHAVFSAQAFLLPNNKVYVTPGDLTPYPELFTNSINIWSSGGLCEIETVASASNNVLTYTTSDYNELSIINTNNTGNITVAKAQLNNIIPGPFSFDPNENSAAITGISTTLNQQINANQNYQLITVNSTTGFPNQEGYLVFGFGTDLATFPVKYLFISSSTQIAIDNSFIFPKTLPTGTTVIFLAQKGTFIPENPESVGSFYLTDSISGRLSASSTIDTIAAVGANVNKTVLYPSSIGLGNGDSPVKIINGNTKIDDVVYIYGNQEDLTKVRGF